MKRRIHEFRVLYRAWAPHLGRFCAIGYCWWLSWLKKPANTIRNNHQMRFT